MLKKQPIMSCLSDMSTLEHQLYKQFDWIFFQHTVRKVFHYRLCLGTFHCSKTFLTNEKCKEICHIDRFEVNILLRLDHEHLRLQQVLQLNHRIKHYLLLVLLQNKLREQKEIN